MEKEKIAPEVKELFKRTQDLCSDVNDMVQDLEDLGSLPFGSDEYEIRQMLNMSYGSLKSVLRYIGYARSIIEF